jgi:hypothetical protein
MMRSGKEVIVDSFAIKLLGIKLKIGSFNHRGQK